MKSRKAIMAIDPGTTESAYVIFHNNCLEKFGKVPNCELREWLFRTRPSQYDLHVEMIASYGMSVGAEVFETCVWIGRFLDAFDPYEEKPGTRVPRQLVRLHMCGSPRAKDSNVRQALIDRFGGSKGAAIGSKRQPGPLYGVSGDVWQALALAVYAQDRRAGRAAPEPKAQW